VSGGDSMSEKIMLEDVLDALIELEEAGSQLYSELSRSVNNEEMADLFQHFSEQEREHKETYQCFKLSLTSRNVDDEEFISYMKIMLQKQIEFLSETNRPETIQEALCQALRLEKDTIYFLLEMKELVEVFHQEEINEIINEERKHLKHLYELEVKYFR